MAKSAAPLSLTPRETSSGLRPPRLAVNPRDAARGAMPSMPAQKTSDVANVRSARKKPGDADTEGEPPPTPTREALRHATRGLRDRRLQKTGNTKFDAKDAVYQSIAQAIRDRTALTLKQANAAPDSANVSASREAELQRQRTRLEELRKVFDTLHADLVSKEESKRLLEVTIALDKRAPMLNDSLPPEDGGAVGGAHAMRAPHAPTTPRSNPSRTGGSRRAGRPSTMQSVATSCESAAYTAEVAAELAQKSHQSSVYDPPLDAPAQLALMRDRVDVAQAELKEMLFQCEVLAHMEHRTRMANNSIEAELDQLRHVINKLCKEDDEINELSEDAHDALRVANRELQSAREAHADQQRAYQDMLEQRSTVISEKKKSKERENAFEEGERAAKLDGKGELDEQGELELLRSANDVTAARVASTLEKESAQKEVSKAEEIYQKLRRSTHDPEAISTPQDLLATMLSAKDRGIELQNQVDRTEEVQHQLTQDVARYQQELNNIMYFGSSSQLVAEAEREFEPQLAAADVALERSAKRCNNARGLVHDAKIGVALLMHLTHGESVDKIIPDGELPAALDRIERHLTNCMGYVKQHTNPSRTLGPRAAARIAAEASAAPSPEPAAVDISGDDAEGRASPSLVPQPPPYPKPADSSADSRALLSMGAALMGKGANNVRVFTFEEVENVLDTLPEEEPEGVDDDGNELNLTRRARRSSADASSYGKRSGMQGKRGNAPAGAPAAARRGAYA